MGSGKAFSIHLELCGEGCGNSSDLYLSTVPAQSGQVHTEMRCIFVCCRSTQSQSATRLQFLRGDIAHELKERQNNDNAELAPPCTCCASKWVAQAFLTFLLQEREDRIGTNSVVRDAQPTLHQPPPRKGRNQS